jgi:hypothetical protein
MLASRGYEGLALPLAGLPLAGLPLAGFLVGLAPGGLPYALVGALSYGGYACVSHYARRLLLWRSGAMPLNYVPFLNACVDRIFLQQVGGGYISFTGY